MIKRIVEITIGCYLFYVSSHFAYNQSKKFLSAHQKEVMEFLVRMRISNF
ncbi:hypothetical protein [Helicobacter cetorum]|nr:hypothetical protein [Helicobacter cetorum]